MNGCNIILLPRSRGSMAKSGLCSGRAQPWYPTFALRLLEDTGFFIQIIFLGTFDFTGSSSRHISSHTDGLHSIFLQEHNLATVLDLPSHCPRDCQILRTLPTLNSNRWYRFSWCNGIAVSQ